MLNDIDNVNNTKLSVNNVAKWIYTPAAVNNVLETVKASEAHTTLDKALIGADFNSLLAAPAAPGPFTLFAPTNAAFEALGKATTDTLLLPANKFRLKMVMGYHAFVGKHEVKHLTDGLTLKSSMTQVVKVEVTTVNSVDTITINDAKVSSSLAASNGVVHVIDKVLWPMDMVEMATTKQLTELVKALTAADLVTTLEGFGPFTVFAPTDEAFNALPELTRLLKVENKADLISVLKYHIVSGYNRVDATGSSATPLTDGLEITTLHAGVLTVKVDGTSKAISIGGAKITSQDNIVINGALHVVDKVLVPPTQ